MQRAGRNFKGLCPFHGEKTPSFVVYPENAELPLLRLRGQWRHFRLCHAKPGHRVPRGAGAAGPQGRGGTPHRATTPRRPATATVSGCTRRWPAAALYWHNLLVRAPSEGREGGPGLYPERGLTEATIAGFQLGYAPDSWDATSELPARARLQHRRIARGGAAGRARAGRRRRASTTASATGWSSPSATARGGSPASARARWTTTRPSTSTRRRRRSTTRAPRSTA